MNIMRGVQTNIKVSVIIPVYNTGKYLKKCLDSIINQTLQEIEIICINDASTDNSLEILNEYALKDKRFVVISQENQGQGVARNNGMKTAKGEYTVFVDPDDYIELDMLELLYNTSEKNNANITMCSIFQHNTSGYIFINDICLKRALRHNLNYMPYSFIDFKNIKDKKHIFMPDALFYPVWAKIYKTKFLLDNGITFAPYKKGEDQPFTIHCILLTPVYYINKPLYHYVKHEYTASSSSEWQVYAEISDEVEKILKKLCMFDTYKKSYDEYMVFRYKIMYQHLYKNRHFLKFFFDNRKKWDKAQTKLIIKYLVLDKIFSVTTTYRYIPEFVRHKYIRFFGIKMRFKMPQTRAAVRERERVIPLPVRNIN